MGNGEIVRCATVPGGHGTSSSAMRGGVRGASLAKGRRCVRELWVKGGGEQVENGAVRGGRVRLRNKFGGHLLRNRNDHKTAVR